MVLSVGAAVGHAENWPQWRGPQGNGVSPLTGVPTTWDRETNVKWQTSLAEPGNSTPVVWGDAIFLAQPRSEQQQRGLLCFDRETGLLRWQTSVPYEEEEATHRTNPYCSSSPVTDGERVMVWLGSAGLHCFDMQGNRLWQRDLGPQSHMWGYGTSPILVGSLCILNFGPGTQEKLLAVDKTTGDTVWEVAALEDADELALSGHENNGNADPPKEDASRAEILRGSWGTPIVVNAAGRQELVVAHPRRITAYNPQTGELLWTCGGYAPLVYASPMYGDGHIVALGGYAGASLAVRPGGNGNVTETHRAWHKPRDGSWLGTGVVHEGHLYIGDMQGILHCIKLDTGDVAWKERLPGSSGRGDTWSSITMSGDGLMYLLNQGGDTFVFRPSPKGYEQIARNALGEDTNASIVLTNGQVLIRTQQSLWCIE
jgi:outer membrane protein assembly factor BamB